MDSHRYESTITGPDGITVQVVITVPLSATWKDTAECGELAAMNATRVTRYVRDSKERCPF